MGGNHVDVIEKRRVVPDLGGVDARLRPLIEQMLQPNPEERPASMAEVAAWTPDAPPIRRPRRRRSGWAKPAREGVTIGRTTLLLGGAAVVGLVAAAPFLYSALHPSPRTPPPPPVLQSELAASASKPAPAPPPAPAPVPARPGLAPMDLTRLEPEPVAPVDPGEAAARKVRLATLVKTLKDYDGGECFFAAPTVLADGSPAIEGYGLSTAPFRTRPMALKPTLACARWPRSNARRFPSSTNCAIRRPRP
jgi:serine/threonine-protein kinase